MVCLSADAATAKFSASSASLLRQQAVDEPGREAVAAADAVHQSDVVLAAPHGVTSRGAADTGAAQEHRAPAVVAGGVALAQRDRDGVEAVLRPAAAPPAGRSRPRRARRPRRRSRPAVIPSDRSASSSLAMHTSTCSISGRMVACASSVVHSLERKLRSHETVDAGRLGGAAGRLDGGLGLVAERRRDASPVEPVGPVHGRGPVDVAGLDLAHRRVRAVVDRPCSAAGWRRSPESRSRRARHRGRRTGCRRRTGGAG